MPNPLERLKHHVTGAIERGEAIAIFEQPTRAAVIERVARFVQSHPGFYVSHNARGVTLQIEMVQVSTGEQWTEYQTVWSIVGAREALGY